MRHIIFNIILSLLIIGCSTPTEQKEDSKQKEEKNAAPDFVDLTEKQIGFWVSKDYYKALKETKSTKKAGGIGVDDFYRISKDNSIMRLNIHEGGADNIMLMTSENKGQIYSSDTSEIYFEVQFQDETLLVENKEYIKAPDNKNGLNQLVNSAFIAGKYSLNEKEIEFKENGEIIGLDSILSFELNLDYIDAGMQYDKIFFQYKGEKELRTYLYAFNSDTLIISKIDCKVQAEDYDFDYCLEVEKGEEIHKLIKK